MAAGGSSNGARTGYIKNLTECRGALRRPFSNVKMEEDSDSEDKWDDGSGDDMDTTGATGQHKIKPPELVLSSEASLKPSPSMDYTIIRTLLTNRLRDGIGLNLDQDVKQYKEVLLGKREGLYRVRRVVSPFEFYLEIANFPEPRLYANWFQEMQTFYQDPNNRQRLHVHECIPIVGRCYVCRDFKDGKWHRVRLHDIRHLTDVLTVYFLDLCKMQATEIGCLLELDPKFSVHPANIYRCYLHDILPKGEHDSLVWSEEACSYFTNFVKNKEFTGVTFTRSDTLISKGGVPDFITTLGVVLVENIPGTEIPSLDVCTLNAHMVDMGLAVATGISAGCRHTIEIKGYEAPSFEELSVLQKDLSAIAIANLSVNEGSGSKIPDDTVQQLCSENGSIGSLGSSELLRTGNGMTMEKAEGKGIRAYYLNTTNNFPAKFACRLASIDITFISNPGCVFVRQKSKNAELKAMQKALKQMVEKEPKYLRNGSPGTFVACLLMADNCSDDDAEKTLWSRGIIKSASKNDKEPSYKILLVDRGSDTTVAAKHVFHLPACFQEIPSFVNRVHLDVEDLEPVGSDGAGWSTASAIDFRRYCYVWKEVEPNYFLYRHRNAETINLSHFNQNIVYDATDGKWLAVQGTTPSFNIIDNFTEHPMVRNLFISLGVDIQYEIICENRSFWSFETILDDIISNGGAKMKKLKRSAARFHLDLCQAASSCRLERNPEVVPTSGKVKTVYSVKKHK